MRLVRLNGRRAEPIEKAAAEIAQAGGTSLACARDATKAADVKTMVDGTVRTFGRPDILVSATR
jgi:NAD(P)-dependent dehydrogenase (short-subunit alcohol dehydrogenase family)